MCKAGAVVFKAGAVVFKAGAVNSNVGCLCVFNFNVACLHVCRSLVLQWAVLLCNKGSIPSLVT